MVVEPVWTALMAAAWAMLTTTAISFFINAYYPGKLFGFGAIAQLQVAWKLVIATAMMVAAVFFIKHDNALVEIILKVIVGGPVYGLMLYLLKVEMFTKNVRVVLQRLGILKPL